MIRRTAILEASSSLPISDVSCAFPRLPIATSSELQTTFTAAYSSAACARRQKGGRRKSTWYGCVGERMRNSRFRIPHSVGSPLPSAQNNWQLGIPDPKLGRVRTSRARGGTKSSTLVDLASSCSLCNALSCATKDELRDCSVPDSNSYDDAKLHLARQMFQPAVPVSGTLMESAEAGHQREAATTLMRKGVRATAN